MYIIIYVFWPSIFMCAWARICFKKIEFIEISFGRITMRTTMPRFKGSMAATHGLLTLESSQVLPCTDTTVREMRFDSFDKHLKIHKCWRMSDSCVHEILSLLFKTRVQSNIWWTLTTPLESRSDCIGRIREVHLSLSNSRRQFHSFLSLSLSVQSLVFSTSGS